MTKKPEQTELQVSEISNGLNKKLLSLQKMILPITKDAMNPHFKKPYASLPQILSAVKPLMTELGLILSQPISAGKVFTNIIDSESGELVSSDIELPQNLEPQKIGSAITYFRRYLLSGLLSLEIEDDDAEGAKTNGAISPNTKAEEDSRAWLNQNTETYDKAVEAIISKTATVAQIEKKYKLSKEVKSILIDHQNA